MTDLISRPTRRSAHPGQPDAGGSAGAALNTRAMVAGVAAAATTLVICMSVAVTGWFLADAGGHGNTKDALRVGADAWLVGHGSRLTAAGVALGIVPLALTAVLLLGCFRFGRWAGRVPVPLNRREPQARVLGIATILYAGGYLVFAVLVCVLASEPGASPVLGRAVPGAVLIGTAGGGLGLAAGTGILASTVARVPGWIRALVFGAVTGVVALIGAGAVLAATSLLLNLNEAATVISRLHLSVGDAVSYLLVVALVAPNCVLLATSYLLGPGFAVGTGTVVSPTAVALGPMPAFPLLAALPDEGPTPGWLVALMAVPILTAVLGAAVAQRRTPAPAYDLAALRGACSGFLGGVLTTVLIAVAGGPMGTGRMADIGASFGDVLMFGTAGMSVGGLVGGVLMAWWMRRRSTSTTQ